MITFILTTLTLVSNILFCLGIIIIAFDKKARIWVFDFVHTHVVALLLTFSLSAVLGSLAYSNIIGFPPCELCWFQRIFMYPQALIAFIALLKKDASVVVYSFALSVFGIVVAFYHSMVHWGFMGGLLGCTAIGGECGKVYVLEYRYITIPFMALSIFVYLIAISVIYYKSKNVRG